MQVNEVFKLQQKYRWQLKNKPVSWRKKFLKNLINTLWKYENEICKAHHADFKKPYAETLISEIYPVIHECRLILRNLNQWASPLTVASGPLLLGTKSQVYFEAKGNVLIISPWNYPFSLALVALASAIGAGNSVILKPSELTPHVGQLLKTILSEVFPPEMVWTEFGGVETSENLLNLPFDHIFFTGSTTVGKIVMAKASQHLSSVTLELGGKSPAFIDSTNIDVAAEKIAWGKFLNAGQTCVAPDYVFVDEASIPAFVDKLQKSLIHQYGQSPQHSESLASVISEKHFNRLKKLVSDSLQETSQLYLISGVTTPTQIENFKDLRFPPVIVVNPKMNSDLMTQEIFGPVLPIIPMSDVQRAIEFVQNNPKPLALYIFSKKSAWIKHILQQTSSGGICINETILHLGNHHLPFGGIGESGVGNYHGEYGFRTFSHSKAVLKQGFLTKLTKLFYPPYNLNKYKFFRFLLKIGF